jgi:peptide/nickel transport system substrate-binding protein
MTGDSGVTRRRLLSTAAAAAASTSMLGPAAAQAARAVTSRRAATPRNSLVIAAPATPSTLDNEFSTNIQSNDAIALMYDNLVQFGLVRDPKDRGVRREDLAFHPNLKNGWNIKPQLATSWELLNGGRKSVWHLRRGVKSNWGNELTASDVKWTWDRKFELKAIGAFIVDVFGLKNRDSVRVEGPYTVSFNTETINPLHLTLMCQLSTNIFDSKKLSENKSDPWGVDFLKTNSAGFGPYNVTQLRSGVQATFQARDDYWGPKPGLETILYQQVPSDSQRVALLQSGAADVATYLTGRELQLLSRVSGVRVHTVNQGSQMLWIDLNNKIKPFTDVRVRQAMNYAFPQAAAIKSVLQGYAQPLGTGMALIYPGATEAYDYDEDLNKARTLLRQAGYSNGFSTTLTYAAADPTQEQLAVLYQTSLAKIGVKVKLNKLPAATYSLTATKRTQPMMFRLDAAWSPDPGYSAFLYFYSKSFVNFENYKNARVDRMIEQVMRMSDLKTRIPIVRDIQRIYMREAPWTFAVRPKPTLAVRSNVQGWVYKISNHVDFRYFTKS